MNNIKPCELCDAKTSFMANKRDSFSEGQVCTICDKWVCNKCVNWRKSGYDYDILCIECAEKILVEVEQ